MAVPLFISRSSIELTDFNLQHPPELAPEVSAPNDPAPGRRPRSSMTPTLLLRDGWPVAGFGSPGGASIISTVLQIVLRVADFGASIEQAVVAPRFALTSARDEASFEAGWSPDLIAGLRALGHHVRNVDYPVGSVQAIAWPVRTDAPPAGAADPRRDGTVLTIPQ